MRIVEFPQQNVVYGIDQTEYQPLPAHKVPNDKTGTTVFCFELTDEEMEAVKLNGNKIFFTQLTFNNPLQPVNASVNLNDFIK